MLRTREPTRHCFNGWLAQTNRVYRIRRQGVTKANPVADSLSAWPYFAWFCLTSIPPSLHLALMHLEHCWLNCPLSCKANPVLAAQQLTSPPAPAHQHTTSSSPARCNLISTYRRFSAGGTAAYRKRDRYALLWTHMPNFCLIIQTKVFWVHKIFWGVAFYATLRYKRVTGQTESANLWTHLGRVDIQSFDGINILQQHRNF